MPNSEISSSFKNEKLELDEYNYLLQVEKLTSPAKTNIKGVFVAGTASGPMDIPDSILSAGDASAEATSYLRRPCTC